MAVLVVLDVDGRFCKGDEESTVAIQPGTQIILHIHLSNLNPISGVGDFLRYSTKFQYFSLFPKQVSSKFELDSTFAF